MHMHTESDYVTRKHCSRMHSACLLTIVEVVHPLVTTPPSHTPWSPLPPGHTSCPIACWDTPPRGKTDTCKNITFPQLLLRAVSVWMYQFVECGECTDGVMNVDQRLFIRLTPGGELCQNRMRVVMSSECRHWCYGLCVDLPYKYCSTDLSTAGRGKFLSIV